MFDETTRELLDRLWTLFYDAAVRTLRRLGVDEQDLDDVVVAVFIAWGRDLAGETTRRESPFERDAPRLPPDLYRHCRQHAFNYRRSRRRSRLVLEADLSCFGRADRAAAELRMQFAQLQDLVADDEAWEVYVLHEVEGMTLPEIAALLSVEPDKARKRLERTRERVRAILARDAR